MIGFFLAVREYVFAVWNNVINNKSFEMELDQSEASKRWDFNENYARGFDKECSWQVWNNCDKKCLKTKRISARYLGIRVKHENVSDFTFTFPRIIVVRMMASSNGNVFRVTGHLCGELTSPRWIPRKRPVTRNFDFFSVSEKTPQ